MSVSYDPPAASSPISPLVGEKRKEKNMRQLLSVCLVALTAVGPVLTPAAQAADAKTATPIKHLVVIFGENRSFDHYFGTYPNALNPKGEPQFHAAHC
jgi:phospholipase C